jgi:hypothetical protein
MRQASQSQSGQEVRAQRMSVLSLSAHRDSVQTTLRDLREQRRASAWVHLAVAGVNAGPVGGPGHGVCTCLSGDVFVHEKLSAEIVDP